VVAGRGLPLLLVFFIAVGEIYSSLSFLGQPGWSYAYGVPILWATMNGTMVAMMSYWLGPKIWQRAKEQNFLTQAQYLGASFASPRLRAIVAAVSLIALVPYISVQIIGAGSVFRVTTEGRIPYWLGSLVASTCSRSRRKGGLRGISGWRFSGIFMLTVGGVCDSGDPQTIRRAGRDVPSDRSPQPGAPPCPARPDHELCILVQLDRCRHVRDSTWPHLFQNFFSAGTRSPSRSRPR
jgi:SSS family solute:Na+ symporter